MSLTLLGWLVVASSIAISALLVFPLRSTGSRLAPLKRLVAAVFLLVAGIGVATSYLGAPPKATGSLDSSSQSRSDSNGEMVARLKDYTRSIGAEEHAAVPAAGKLLPDVNTMIERLASRPETAPEAVKGWRMLGWSYFHAARYEHAAAAFAKALALDPNSAELKGSYEEAKAKAAETARQTGAVGPSVEKH